MAPTFARHHLFRLPSQSKSSNSSPYYALRNTHLPVRRSEPSTMGIGPPLPPSLARARALERASSSPAEARPQIGPPRPQTTAANSAEPLLSASPPAEPRKRSRIGPPLPPSLAREAGPEAEAGRAVIGPPLPPTARPAAPEKDAWAAVRKREADASEAGPARHPGDAGREDWMTLVPEVTGFRGGSEVVDGKRGFGTGRSVASGGGLAVEGRKAPVRPGDALLEDGDESDSGEEEKEEKEKERVVKKARVEGGASLLDMHRATRKREKETEGPGKLKQFDREKEFSNHKRRDVGHYAQMGGGLAGKYDSASRQ